MRSLQILEFCSLPILLALSQGIQHATGLESLMISDCKRFTSIPEWINNLKSLQILSISACPSLKSLPEGMRYLTSLDKIEIKDCPTLQQRCQKHIGQDWPKIAHIPNLVLQQSFDQDASRSFTCLGTYLNDASHI
ncbi:LRR domain containing protein [Trema orientale]|uniref:LRR domain containing protein n=1 Tax=Trema orientale TaxID=63057 RepID=A0A2P5BD64_TREOI|nr:LRR domain containing protein [Trema orientale]